MAIVYTPLADPLRAFVAASRANTSGPAASLLTAINYNADIFSDSPQIITGNYGFDGYIGIPGLDGTDAATQAIAASYNVAWETLDPALNGAQRAYTSGVSTSNALAVYGVNLLQADTIPVVFSHPVLPTRLNPTDFLVTRSDGTQVTPLIAAFLPNLEFNERQTVVIAGDFGNRLQPGQPGALYPVSVTVVNDGSPLELLTATGPVNAVGLTVASANAYVAGNGPRLVAAKLNVFSDLGEGGPIGTGLASQNNSGSDLYGLRARYRLRLYTSAGFSPDGIASLLPTEFERYFILEALDDAGNSVQITQAGVPTTIGSAGTVTVVGLADLAQAGATVNAAYVEDHDNYYDVILEGDPAAIARLISVRMPSSGAYQQVFSPGGPGNDPTAAGAAPGPFTVGSSDHTIAITQDLAGQRLVTFVEVDGPVLRNPWSSQPIGTNLGVAVTDTITGQKIFAYSDPAGLRFFASFSAAADLATTLPGGLASTQPIDLLDTTALTPGSSATVTGSLSRSAAFSSTLRFYEVVDRTGGVRDPLTGRVLQPGDPGYQAAALNPANELASAGASLSVGDLDVVSFRFTVAAGMLYAPVVTITETAQRYFGFAAANSDGISHFNGFAPNSYGIEDLQGGGDRDYDDLILSFSLGS